MRGKERFSAPGETLDLTMRFSAGNSRGLKANPHKGHPPLTPSAIQDNPGKE
jgi:hypothetical protein